MAQTNKKKAVPNHAYSFSAAGVFLISSTVNYLMSGHKTLSLIGSIATLGFVAHGLNDLHREHRLGRVLTPVTRFFQSIFEKKVTHENEQTNTLRFN